MENWLGFNLLGLISAWQKSFIMKDPVQSQIAYLIKQFIVE